MVGFSLRPGKLNTVFNLFSGSQSSKRPSLKKVRFFESDSTLYRICLVGSLASDKETNAAAKQFSLPVVVSSDGLEYARDKKYITYFILSDFESEEFQALYRRDMRIIGKPAFMEMSLEGVIHYENPVYCLTMINCNISIIGFEDASVTAKLIRLIGYMGGNYRNQLNNTDEDNYLVTYSSKGNIYRSAIANDVKVMSEGWIYAAWDYRNSIRVKANHSHFSSYLLKIFQNLKIVLIGFSNEERTSMESFIKDNGGISKTLKDNTVLEDNTITHVVVNNKKLLGETLNLPTNVFVVEEQWFWNSLAKGYSVDENLHLFDNKVAKSPSANMYSPRFIRTNRLSDDPLCRGRYAPIKPLVLHPEKSESMFGSNCIHITIFIFILLIAMMTAYYYSKY